MLIDKCCTLLNVHLLEANAKPLFLTFTVKMLSLFSLLDVEHKDTGSRVAGWVYADIWSKPTWFFFLFFKSLLGLFTRGDKVNVPKRRQCCRKSDLNLAETQCDDCLREDGQKSKHA